jgi:hypothetical protein
MTRSTSLAPTMLFLMACTTVPPPEPPAAATHDEPRQPEQKPAGPACGDPAACFEEAKKAEAAKDQPKARELFRAACDGKHAEACSHLGSIVKEVDKDDVGAEDAWKKGCELGDARGCFNAAESLRKVKPKDATSLYAKACKAAGKDAMLVTLACGRGGVHAYESGDETTAAELARASCTDDQVGGCNLLGVLTLEGKGGITSDPEQAKKLFERACKGGDASACNNEKKMAGALAVPGANLTMGSVTADGFTLTDFKCKTSDGLAGILLGPAAAGVIGKKKGALDACAPKGADVRVRWTTAGRKVTTAEAKAGDPKIEACVVKVMKSVPGVLEGTCAATIHVGK